jgi:hypothetical protein
MKFGGWQRLTAEYAKQFDIETLKLAASGGSKVVNRRIEKTMHRPRRRRRL